MAIWLHLTGPQNGDHSIRAGKQNSNEQKARNAACHMQATDAGLSQGEAKTRLETYGPNRLPHKKRNPVLQYLGYTAAEFASFAC